MTERKDYIEEEIWFSATDRQELAKYDKDKAFAAFQQRQVNCKREHTRYIVKWLSRVAAMVGIFVAISYFSFRGGQNQLKSQMANIVIEVPQGSRTQMHLPDGTSVWLNAGSKISYSQSFGISERQVSVSGEGYFEVARNEHLPLIVHSDNAQVRVLGTKFNIRDYPSDKETVIVLLEGIVALNSFTNTSNVQRLKPGQRASIDKRTGKMQIEEYEVDNCIQWTVGRLIFDGESLFQIARDLERCYNVKVAFANKDLMHLRFYGDFYRQEQSIGEILDALVATGNVKYRRKGTTIEFY